MRTKTIIDGKRKATYIFPDTSPATILNMVNWSPRKTEQSRKKEKIMRFFFLHNCPLPITKMSKRKTVILMIHCFHIQVRTHHEFLCLKMRSVIHKDICNLGMGTSLTKGITGNQRQKNSEITREYLFSN